MNISFFSDFSSIKTKKKQEKRTFFSKKKENSY